MKPMENFSRRTRSQSRFSAQSKATQGSMEDFLKNSSTNKTRSQSRSFAQGKATEGSMDDFLKNNSTNKTRSPSHSFAQGKATGGSMDDFLKSSSTKKTRAQSHSFAQGKATGGSMEDFLKNSSTNKTGSQSHSLAQGIATGRSMEDFLRHKGGPSQSRSESRRDTLDRTARGSMEDILKERSAPGQSCSQSRLHTTDRAMRGSMEDFLMQHPSSSQSRQQSRSRTRGEASEFSREDFLMQLPAPSEPGSQSRSRNRGKAIEGSKEDFLTPVPAHKQSRQQSRSRTRGKAAEFSTEDLLMQHPPLSQPCSQSRSRNRSKAIEGSTEEFLTPVSTHKQSRSQTGPRGRQRDKTGSMQDLYMRELTPGQSHSQSRHHSKSRGTVVTMEDALREHPAPSSSSPYNQDTDSVTRTIARILSELPGGDGNTENFRKPEKVKSRSQSKHHIQDGAIKGTKKNFPRKLSPPRHSRSQFQDSTQYRVVNGSVDMPREQSILSRSRNQSLSRTGDRVTQGLMEEFHFQPTPIMSRPPSRPPARDRAISVSKEDFQMHRLAPSRSQSQQEDTSAGSRNEDSSATHHGEDSPATHHDEDSPAACRDGVSSSSNHTKDGFSSDSGEDLPFSRGKLTAHHDGVVASTKKTRGPTRCLKIHAMDDGSVIPITLNAYGQPSGPTPGNVSQLSSYLGTLSRDADLAPLTYITWHKVPNKGDIWELVKMKFDIEERARKWVLQTIGTDWRCYKSRIKRYYFQKFKSNATRLENCPPDIPFDHWKVMVAYWSDPNVKAVSKQNKQSRAFQKNLHTTGSRPFAVIREQERLKRPDGIEPSQAEMFTLTRKRKRGHRYDEETERKLAEYEYLASQIEETAENSTARDALFSQVMGEHAGRLRLFGKGVCSTDVKTASSVSPRVAAEAKRIADQEIRRMQEEMEKMKADMARGFGIIVSRLQEKFPDVAISPDIFGASKIASNDPEESSQPVSADLASDS